MLPGKIELVGLIFVTKGASIMLPVAAAAVSKTRD
jgi:hypothetical protein